MSREIWLSPLLGNSRARLIDRCAELVANNQSKRFLYLAASHPLLELVTQGILDGHTNRGVWGDLPVFLFRGFVRHVLSTAVDENGNSLPPRVPIDREELPLKRSLVAQLLARLAAARKLKAIGPLAGREGCVNSIATLIGEIQRAAKTPAEVAEIIAARNQDLATQNSAETAAARTASQSDFDNEVALIYSTYKDLLDQHQLTEDDADQLRALCVLRGELDGSQLRLPWLESVDLLILDGFFDFTPVQGEILRQLIPRIPETLVNLNFDSRNPEIFAPFRETIGQLQAIADFEMKEFPESAEAIGPLANLRERLFNPSTSGMSDKLQFVDVSTNNTPETTANLTDEHAASSPSDDKLKLIEHSGMSDKLQFVDVSTNNTPETTANLTDEHAASSPGDDKLKLIEHSGMSDKLQFVDVSTNNTPETTANLTDEHAASSPSDDKLKLIEHSGMSDKLQFVDVSTNNTPETTANLTDEHAASSPGDDKLKLIGHSIRYFECGDRDTEIRTIAREVKRLVLTKNYSLADIALIVRQRTAYSQTIARVMREESVPCNLELHVDALDVPAARAAVKLLALLEHLSQEPTPSPRISELANLIKSEYFRLSDEELKTLTTNFDDHHLDLLSENGGVLDFETKRRLKARYRIGFWDADALENAFAYVGSDLPVSAWLNRARKLIKELPSAQATRELLNIDTAANDRDRDIADNLENAETAKLEEQGAEKKRRPSGDIHPATLAWTALVTQRFAELIVAVPREGEPATLRHELIRLLDQLGFREQIARPTRNSNDDRDLPHVMLNFNALESLRRAFVAAIKSIEMSDKLQFVDVSSNNTPETTIEPSESQIDNDDPSSSSDDKLKFVGPAGMSDKLKHIGHLSTFIQEVRRSLASQSQVLSPADRSGLRVLEATDVRGLRFRAVFIAGLVEGGFPLRATRDWIYPHEERDRLKHYGLTLEDISPATLLKEEHYFYQSACRATERLYLSRPLLLEDDSELVASYYVDELRRAIAPSALEAETIRRDYDGREIKTVSNTSQLRVALVRQQERHRHAGDKRSLFPEPRIKRLLTLARNDGLVSNGALRRIEIERVRASNIFSEYDGEVTDPQLVRLLGSKFGPDYVHSASGLSIYGNCPYRFFAMRVLKLEPRGEAALDLQAIDAGKLLHDILRRFFEGHRRESLISLDRKGLRKELAKIADTVFDEHERVVPPLNKQIWKIDREIRKILLDQVLLYELSLQEDTANKAVLPAYFELAFGSTRVSAKDPDSKDEPLQLSRAKFVGEETLKISGQIDRVDVARDNTLVAYDYKLSQGATRDDITSGRSLQIPIYLEALEKLILPGQPIAGGGYYVIRGGNDRRNKGLYRADQLAYTQVGLRLNSVLSEEEWQRLRSDTIAKIWEFLDLMRAGRFVVDPSEREKTCRFCDFSAVCRYKVDRIKRKK